MISGTEQPIKDAWRKWRHKNSIYLKPTKDWSVTIDGRVYTCSSRDQEVTCGAVVVESVKGGIHR